MLLVKALPLNLENAEVYNHRLYGQEQDNEIAGTGNIMTAEFWMYDARLGRRWNLDPVVKEFESSYVVFRNNPIVLKDPNGNKVINGDQIKANKKKNFVIQR